MKRRTFLILGLALISVTGSLSAADATPDGTWKWTVTNPKNNQEREQSVTLKLEDAKLTGTAPGPKGAEIKIENATYKDGQISFSITREGKKQKVTTKFSGKLEGDTITGKSEAERPKEQAQSKDWVAKREKS